MEPHNSPRLCSPRRFRASRRSRLVALPIGSTAAQSGQGMEAQMIARWPQFVFVLLFSVALATSASADCAWVLSEMITGPAAMWQPQSAFDTRELCVAQMAVTRLVAGAVDLKDEVAVHQVGAWNHVVARRTQILRTLSETRPEASASSGFP